MTTGFLVALVAVWWGIGMWAAKQVIPAEPPETCAATSDSVAQHRHKKAA